LEPVVGARAQFHELTLPDGAKMYGVRVLDYRDHALDEANSHIKRLSDGSISHLFPAFCASGLADATMFTLTHCPQVFVTEAISDSIDKASLKGFSFVRYQPR
jgi:hypothetical protein